MVYFEMIKTGVMGHKGTIPPNLAQINLVVEENGRAVGGHDGPIMRFYFHICKHAKRAKNRLFIKNSIKVYSTKCTTLCCFGDDKCRGEMVLFLIFLSLLA